MKRTLLLDPRKALVTWDDVKAARNRAEIEPIQFNGRPYQVDDASIQRLEQAQLAYHLLTEEDPDGKLAWKCADNSFVQLNVADLSALLLALKTTRGQRAVYLHKVAEQLHQSLPDLTRGELEDALQWNP